ncbi:MAG: CDP-alcohol phosphatidyltransferase family protein [Hyphomicrobiales bacterium]
MVQLPVSLPNLITILRILLVPLAVNFLIDRAFAAALVVFIVAGVSDGVDGYIARRFNLQSELGAYLDPLADKALLVSIYVTLAFQGLMPTWLAIVVVTRDVLIVGAVLLAWVMDRPMSMKPFWISKLNTVAQIVFAVLLLATLAAGWQDDRLILASAAVVGFLTTASGLTYMRFWVRHMMAAPSQGKPL